MIDVQPTKIVTSPAINHTPAFLFMLEHYVKLVRDGHGDLEFAYYNNSSVTYAIRGDEVLGGIVWQVDTARKICWIQFSATAEVHRQTGIYTKLYKDVERQCRSMGVIALYSGVAVNNEPMIAAAQSNGRAPGFFRMKKTLTQ